MSTERRLPPIFESRMNEELGGRISGRLLEALRMSPPARPAVRLNRRKGAHPGPDLCSSAIPWSGGDGFYLHGDRPTFAYDPAWHAGLYYVQDASSMAVTAAIREIVTEHCHGAGPLVCLDACAAPGGKTIAAIDALPEGSIVVANEFDRRRAGILVENLQKWGYPRVAASCGDTSVFRNMPPVFDIACVDAPCSGEGMMRKEAEAIAQWSPGLVDGCASLQREIIANVWPSLKPGGFLIYSTCTFNRAENEENVRRIEQEYGARRIVINALETASGPVSVEEGCYHFLPGFVDGEGLFLAVLRKPDDASTPTKAHRQRSRSKTDADAAKFAIMTLGQGFSALSRGDSGYDAVPDDCVDLFTSLSGKLDMRLRGVTFAGTKGRMPVPAHGLALSAALRQDAFPRAEFADYASAIAYLRGESTGRLPADTPSGTVLMTWQGVPAGFVKNLGKRFNNLYPRELRLKTLPAPGSTAPRICCVNAPYTTQDTTTIR